MRRNFVAAIAAIVVFAGPGPVLAAWDWTTWEMSAREVIAASRGKIREDIGGSGARVNGWWLKASGDIAQDGFAFRGEFFFDEAGDRLHVIRLNLKDPGQCAQLAETMTRKHGPPRDQSQLLAGTSIKLTALKWDDDGKGNFLALTSVPAVNDLEPLCFIRYRPLDEPDVRR